jgi:predicted DNA binding CopG/RHH family protein
LAPDTGAKVKKYMKKKIIFSDEIINARVVKDFLPKPEELILKQKQVKVTLALSKNSVDFFKSVAKKEGAKYQAMIRQLIDYYVANQ